jgi:predicted  nucleic acid-binding Zn-ribbon protein
MNLEPLREFVSLENHKKELDADLKATKQRLDELEETIIPMFIEEGVPSMTVEVDGAKRTLSIYPDVYASPLNDREEVVDALKRSELEQYVAENYNTNSLTAFVREVWKELRQTAAREERAVTEDDLRAALPLPLQGVLKLSLIHKLSSTRKA